MACLGTSLVSGALALAEKSSPEVNIFLAKVFYVSERERGIEVNPTREQIEAAREIAEVVVAECKAFAPMLSQAMATFLAATAEPTDEELEREAERIAHERKHVEPIRVSQFVHAYIAGARREGRR